MREALRQGSQLLEGTRGESPYLDALVLLATAYGTTKEHLYGALEESLAADVGENYRKLLERRAAGTPVAYLTRSKEFFGREFYIDERVLIPRPDTEILVETALAAASENPALRRLHDLGTGSGCIALTIKAERPDLEVSASDPSHGACEVFRINARRLGLEVALSESPFFRSLRGPFDIVVSNPPYLTDSEADAMAASGWPEPQEALRSGKQGLDHIAQIIGESVHFLIKGGKLLLEAAPWQTAAIRELMHAARFEEVSVVADLAGRERVVHGVKNG